MTKLQHGTLRLSLLALSGLATGCGDSNRAEATLSSVDALPSSAPSPDMAAPAPSPDASLDSGADPFDAFQPGPDATPMAPDAAQPGPDVAHVATPDASAPDAVVEQPLPDAAAPDAAPEPEPAVPEGFVRIAPGVFTMGMEPGALPRSGVDTQHEVTITRPFFLKSTETTQAEWQALMGNNPSSFANCGGDCPVEQVSWNDAVDYCNALSQQQGLAPCYDANRTFLGLDCQGYRLPTEAEWEYAARAGTVTSFYTGGITNPNCDPVDPNLDAAGWYCGNSKNTTHPGAQKLPNEWGLYDMHGNVSEWVNDAWDALDYPAGPARDPLGSAAGVLRALRGGGLRSDARFARSGTRYISLPEERYDELGLRPARSL
jgi:formylglycine-generating enzyme required for sulfatase activity